ncbi:MAG TPA: hydroxymethylpyrimidine/phosphomethylpyrimidine kinase [Cytophagaceae bacterium]|jgi:hydroxymethylpyrimidine/phosphomethylpyrimidine kinase|nr:hydroxymethylpyrimidine/phosphomethylpyrimidine kinase [Cytophagaceae bacterium]
MKQERPNVLSIAGFDPCGGAGLLSDCKVFEMHQVQGMGVCTSLTFQNESEFAGLTWVSLADIEKQMEMLFKKYAFGYVKIGLVQGLNELDTIIDSLQQKNPTVRIVWDPILKASAGYDFHNDIDAEKLIRILKKIYLLVPNFPEMELLNPDGVTPAISARKMSKYCRIFLKGGHSTTNVAEDILFENEKQYVFTQNKIENGEKHGSGCVLSSAILANLAKGYELVESCRKAKNYTAGFLSSTKGLLGYHCK